MQNLFDTNKNWLSNALTNSFDPYKNELVTKLSTDSTLSSITKLLSNSNTFKLFQNLNS